MGEQSEIILISASAGSGKTHALTRRYVTLLLGGAEPQTILAVTFTNNAAKEMRERILGWLKLAASGTACQETDQLMEDTGLKMPALKAKAGAILQDLLSNYYNLHVQTIDSFLNRIAMAAVGELGMPLHPEITMSHRRLTDVALYSLLSREEGASLTRDEIDKFLDSLPPGNAYPWDPVEKLREIYENFLTFEGKSEGSIVPADADEKKVRKAQDAIVEKSRALLKEADAGKHTYGDKKPYGAAVKKKAREAIEAGNYVAIVDAFGDKYGFFDGVKMRSQGNVGPFEAATADIRAAIGEYIRLHAYHRLAGFVKIYPRFKAELERIKSGVEDVAHIDDIAKKITAYLKRTGGAVVPEVYVRLGEQVKHFLIDEFQDTDPLQWRALMPLIHNALSNGGSLFVVGDIKQAIYMFRYADYKIMRRFMDALAGKDIPDGDPLGMETLIANAEPRHRVAQELKDNHRSGGVLVEYAAGLFKERLPAYRGGELLSKDNDPTGLTSYHQAAEKSKAKAGLFREFVFSRKDLKEAAADSEDAADPADAPVSAKVVELIKDAHKRYRYDQIAVLAPQNNNIRAVVGWLNAAGVPVASMSSLDIRERAVVAELIALLTFLEFPGDDVAFLNFACGDIFLKASGLPREKVLAAAEEHRRQKDAKRDRPLYKIFEEMHGAAWKEYLAPLFTKVGYLPVYELGVLAFSRLRVFANFKDEACFLVKFLEVLASLQGEGAADARSFINFANDEGEDAAGAFSIELPEYIDAVRVMTFHKSKGLGFPVVINLLYEKRGQGGSASDRNIYYDRDGAEVRVVYIKKEFCGWEPRFAAIAAEREADEKVQALNELYVVTTRAKNELYNLVIRGAAEQGENSAAKFHYVFDSEQGGQPDKRAKAEPPAHKPALVRQPPAPELEAAVSRGTTLEAYRAKQRGLLHHDILMRIDWLGPDLEARLGAAFDACAWKYSRDLWDEKAPITAALLRLLAKPDIARFFEKRPGRALRRETEFISRPAAGGLLRLDRLLLEGGKALIVDFKTGAPREEYAAAMRKYAAVIKDTYGVPAECWLIYLDGEKVVEVK